MSGETPAPSLEGEASKCPIIRVWMDMPVLMGRAATGKIAEVGKDGIGREAVSANADILEPVILEFGNLA